MKGFTKKSNIQKTLITIVIMILFNFAIPQISFAAEDDDGWSIGGSLVRELVQLVDAVGDSVMGLLNKAMLGTDKIYGSVMLEQGNPNLTTEGSSLYASDEEIAKAKENGTLKEYTSDHFNGLGFGSWKVPNMLYCPENIFANKISALDVNFIHPNKYTDVMTGKEVESYAAKLSPIISSWYKAFRNISIVGLLCVLIYIGIRILLETSVQGKAKYKEMIKDWFVALCLVFAIHLIMSGTLMIIQQITNLLTNSIEESAIVVQIDNNVSFKTNLTGYVRLLAESDNWSEATSYSIIYISLVIYTVIFTFTYLKRFLYMAFFTMIAPLVALTYPLDKVGDGKAQAFNLWFKEYTMNAILQPVHLLLYTMLVSTAASLAVENPIYALAAIAFLIPAEKFIKKMFKLDSETAGGAGTFAGGALAMSALQRLTKKPPLPKPGANDASKGGADSANNRNKIRTQDRETFGAFGGDSSNQQEPEENNDGVRTQDPIEGNIVPFEERKRQMEKSKLEDQLAEGTINPEDLTQEQKNLFENDNKPENTNGNANDTTNEPENIDRNANTSSIPNQMSRRKGALGRTLIRGVKATAKSQKFRRAAGAIGKGAIRTAGAVMGGTVGLAAGLTTGDLSKAAQYTVAGAAAGNVIGKNLSDGAVSLARGGISTAKGIQETAGNIGNAYKEEAYGMEYASNVKMQKQNEKAKKEFMKDSEQKRKYQEMAEKISREEGKDCSVQDVMNAAFDYNKAGITDDEKIQRGLAMETRYGGIGKDNHEKMIDVMNLTNKYNKEYITDDKKRGSLEKVVQSSGLSKKNQKDVMEMFAEAHGDDLKKFYQKHGGIK